MRPSAARRRTSPSTRAPSSAWRSSSKLEVSRKLGSLGIGVGLGAGAALFALYAVGFLFATIAAGLATVLDVWLALLIVTLFLLLLTALLGLLAVNRIQKGAPPVPEQAIEEAKLTSEALKSDGRSG